MRPLSAIWLLTGQSRYPKVFALSRYQDVTITSEPGGDLKGCQGKAPLWSFSVPEQLWIDLHVRVL
jgi:hypothetical protein